jgi:malate dehydrogenase (quinone)
MTSPEWEAKLKEMIPSYGQSLADNPELCARIRQRTSNALKLS